MIPLSITVSYSEMVCDRASLDGRTIPWEWLDVEVKLSQINKSTVTSTFVKNNLLTSHTLSSTKRVTLSKNCNSIAEGKYMAKLINSPAIR